MKDNVYWTKIGSWHVMDMRTGMTICGRVPKGAVTDTRGEAEKSCEACYRIVGPK